MGTVRNLFVLLPALLAFLAHTQSFEDELFIKKPDVKPAVDLEQIAQSNRMTLLKVFSSMCGTCTAFLPEWNKLKRHVGNKLDIIEIDVDEKAGFAFANSIGALEEGLPNLKLFTSYSKKSTTLLQGEGGFANELYLNIIKFAEQDGFIDDSGGYVKSSSSNWGGIKYLLVVAPITLLLLICLVPAKRMSTRGNPKQSNY